LLEICRYHRSSFLQIVPPSKRSRLVCLSLLLLLVFCARFLRGQESAPKARGEEVFASKCAACHGADARGGEYGPALVDNSELHGKPVSWFRNLIQHGVPSAGMPAFNLSTAELDAVATLVHSFNVPATENEVPGDRAAGEQYFFAEGKCGSCHMVRGRGALAGPDLSNLANEMTSAQIRESLLQPSAHIAPGYGLVTVGLRNGETFRGFARSQTNFEITLQEMTGKFHSLSNDEISTITEEKQSAMPVVDAAPAELQNLIAYLSSLDGVKSGAASTTEAGDPNNVSFAQILDAHPENWLTYNGKLSGNRYSELNEINATNVNQLTLRWIYTVPLWQQFYPDSPYFRDNLSWFGLETTPLIADGVMYGTGPQQVFALDARTGRLIWKYSRRIPEGVVGDSSLGSNRGLAILGDKLFMLTSDAHMMALNRTTGQLVWEAIMPEKPMHYGSTVAPLVVKDMVIGGVSGGDWGIRGFVAAYRASDGKLMWRRWTVPAKGDPEAKTWGGNPPETGGAATWVTGSYDPETNTLYWTTGNPYPDGDNSTRPGDNLYSNCILALDADTGRIKWFYQVTPVDLHDWDANAPILLIDTEFQGKARKLLLYSNKNGFFYAFDRTNGQLLLAKPFVKVNWASGIGPDGRPQRLPENGVLCPEAGTNYSATAFSSVTHLYYLMANATCAVNLSALRGKNQAIEQDDRKYLEAMDINDGRIAWKLPQIGPADGKRNGGILATAGGLLFYGDPSGNIVAADARDGKALWHFPTSGENKASPVAYTVNGKQFVALAVGPNILAFGLPEVRQTK
jgi:PQQ-dependent dehydrogenase (methanol/ethanol family)